MARAVILSGSLGSGHHIISGTVADSLDVHGFDVQVLDCMALLGSAGAQIGDRVFRRITAMPGLYDGLHFAHFRQGSMLARAMDRAATHRLVPAIRAELAGRPPDLLFATFALGASSAAKLRHHLPPHRTAVLCTDVDPYWWWVWSEVDLFLVTSRSGAGSVRRYAPHAQVHVVPPPVRPAFYQAPDQASARRALGVPLDAPCVLLMGGGWGLGPVAAAARALAADGITVLAVAGQNHRLRRRLEDLHLEQVLPFGFTDQVAQLMAAADLVLTTPGATTCSEARVVGRHLVILDVLPGHGRQNLQHELEQGGADACGSSADAVATAVRAALSRLPRPAAKGARSPGEWASAFAEAMSSLGWWDDAAAGAPGPRLVSDPTTLGSHVQSPPGRAPRPVRASRQSTASGEPGEWELEESLSTRRPWS